MTFLLHASSCIFSGWPVRDLLQKFRYQPSTVDDRITMGLFFGYDADVVQARAESHLTHSTNLQHQIRYPLRHRIYRGVRRLATSVAPYVPSALIVQVAHDDELSREFFRALESAGVHVTYLPHHDPGFDFANPDEQAMLDMLKTPIDLRGLNAAARERTYLGDYRTAYQLLMRIPESFRTADVHYHLGMCTNYFERTEESERHYLRCFESGDIVTRASAAYMISMLYLRWHSRDKHSVDKAEFFLEQAYRELTELEQGETRDFQRVFNRNGFALCLFRRGRVEEALAMLKAGVEVLDTSMERTDAEGRPSHLHLHRSVLLYNAVQCLATLERFEECEKVCVELIESDPLFPEYHLEIGRIHLMQSKQGTEKVNAALRSFAEAESLDDAIPELHALKGFALIELARWREAKLAYSEALRLDSANTQYREAIQYCEENRMNTVEVV